MFKTPNYSWKELDIWHDIMTLSVKYSRKTLVLSTDLMARNMLHYSFSDGFHHHLLLLDHLKYCLKGSSQECQNALVYSSPCFLHLTLWHCTHPNSVNHLKSTFRAGLFFFYLSECFPFTLNPLSDDLISSLQSISSITCQ